MLLSVKRLGGSIAPYEVELFLNPPRLADLKQAVLEQSGIPIWAQRVFYEGRCLRSAKTLEEQGITRDGNCTLLLAASAHYKPPPAPAAEPPLAPPEPVAPGASSSSEPVHAAPAANPPPHRLSPLTPHLHATQAGSTESGGGGAAEAPASEEVDVSKLSVSELKQRLRERGVSLEGCTEKSDLVELLRECIATGRWEPQEDPPRAATFVGPGFGPGAAPGVGLGPGLGPGAAPFGFDGGGFAHAGVPGAGQPNPLAAFFSQLGPMMGTAMNQAFAQAQAQGQQPPGTGGAAIPVPPAGIPTAAAPGFAGFPQQDQQQQQPGAPFAWPQQQQQPGAQGNGMPASMATLLQQLGPQIASQMGTPPNQSQDFGDITFTTDMNFVMGAPTGTTAGAAPTINVITPEAGGTGTQPPATAGASLPDHGAADGAEEDGHQFL